jgi:hypothetical protein
MSRHFRKLMIGLVLSLAGSEANAVFYGNDVHGWCEQTYGAGLCSRTGRPSSPHLVHA